uniref:Uncharacterized protein n=1 Tax=Strigamia maritima TaxID=126957 RepID=T1IJH3_STRMM
MALLNMLAGSMHHFNEITFLSLDSLPEYHSRYIRDILSLEEHAFLENDVIISQVENFIMNIFGSGAVLKTTDNIESYATSLAQESTHSRSCGIVIANKTKTNLGLPHRYISTGKLLSMPMVIRKETTGLILCENRLLIVEGSCGLVTYKIEDPNSSLQQLQILWYVPLDLNLKACQVNVRLGVESASEDIFQNIVYGYGKMISSAKTPHTLTCSNYEIKKLKNLAQDSVNGNLRYEGILSKDAAKVGGFR